MSKNSVIKKPEPENEDGFDFSGMFDSYENEMVGEMMRSMVESSNHQLTLAVELTKLVVEKSAKAAELNEEKIFAIFKRASEIIAEKIPLKAFADKLA